MTFIMRKKKVSLILGILLLAGCGSGTVIKNNGTTDAPKWHKWNKVILNNHLGTFPNLQSLNQVREGMTKDQLYYLIGRPQYDDGWRPQEWNYLFHFYTPGKGVNNVTTCQYKILFDSKMIARSFYWHPVIPEDSVCPPQKSSASQKFTQRYTLNADALFPFDKSDASDINQQGIVSLDNLAMKLNSFEQLNSIRVIGYTDRLGSPDYNSILSKKRADTIRQYLIAKGIPAGKIIAIGMGKNQPVKECDYENNRTALINCLQPNRRVEVEVDGIIRISDE